MMQFSTKHYLIAGVGALAVLAFMLYRQGKVVNGIDLGKPGGW